MLNSAEVRWFFRGQSPAEVKHWLDMGEQHKQEAREDEYVLIPSCQTTGIKLRNDRFEIKALTCLVGEERFAAKIEGVVEKWAKLILAVPREARIDQVLRAEASTLKVSKVRFLRKYCFDQPNKPTEVVSEIRPRQGCNVELTELRACRSEWWTLGLEAFGDAAKTEVYLRQTVGLALGSEPPPCQLSTHNSMSYPGWLDALTV